MNAESDEAWRMERMALIAGSGALPAAVANVLGGTVPAFAPEGVVCDLPLAGRFRFERLVPFLRMLRSEGVDAVVLAGAMQRPRLDPALLDPETAALLPRLLPALQAGDDATLRAVIDIIEEQGLALRGVAEIAPGLIAAQGVLGRHRPGPRDEGDAERAAQIVLALGSVDVGQGAVVAQGLCLAVEALPGTDAMLAMVAGLAQPLRPPPQTGRGLLYKAAKPQQDLRVDLPAIGPQTVARVAAAGLGGIAFEAGRVVVLSRAETVTAADAAGLFLWARASG